MLKKYGNFSTQYKTQTKDIITAEGKLKSGGDLNITSGNNINFIGTNATSEGNMNLSSQNQTNILAETLTSNLDAVMSTGSKHSSRQEQTVTNIGSTLQAKGSFTSASIADTNIQGSGIVANGNGDIKSLAGDINITNAVDSTMLHTIEKKKNTFSSRHDEVYDYQETAKESILDFGGNLNIGAEVGSLLVMGSIIGSNADMNIDVGGDVNILSAVERGQHWEVHEKIKTDFDAIALGAAVGLGAAIFTGGASIAVMVAGAGAGGMGAKDAKRGSIDKNTVQTQNHVSSNISANNLSIKSGSDTKIYASNITTQENLDIVAKSLDIKSGENKTEIHNEHTKIRPNYVGVAVKAGIDGAVAGWLAGDSASSRFGMNKGSTGGTASGQSNADYLSGKSQYLNKMNTFVDKISFGFAGAVSTPINQLNNFGSSWLVGNTIGLENINTTTNKSTLITNVDSNITVGGIQSINLEP